MISLDFLSNHLNVARQHSTAIPQDKTVMQTTYHWWRGARGAFGRRISANCLSRSSHAISMCLKEKVRHPLYFYDLNTTRSFGHFNMKLVWSKTYIIMNVNVSHSFVELFLHTWDGSIISRHSVNTCVLETSFFNQFAAYVNDQWNILKKKSCIDK